MLADGLSQAETVSQRADAARRRAAHATMLADNLDLLIGDGARLPPDIRARLASTHRKNAERHLRAGILQAAHAWRLRNWAEGDHIPEIVQPAFLSTVAGFIGADSALANLFLFERDPAHALLAASDPD